MTIQQQSRVPQRALAALLVASCFGAVQAAPATPQVVSGQATFQQNGNVFSITNTPNAVINWQSFSINAGEITRFIQQSSDSAVLNRIIGQDPSRILGALQSNGRVYLINPNGILFGREARVDVNGLTASTLNLSDADFLSGKRQFGGTGAAGVVNQGSISTPAGGQVMLIGAQVENSGIITSPQGQVLLAAGHSVQLADAANPSLHVVVSAPAAHALNLGQIVAQQAGIYGALVSQRGVVNANSAHVNEQGKIVLRASGDALLTAGSVTSATGAGRGGEVSVEGARVGVLGDARIDASGVTGGGAVLLGGGYQGKNALLRHSQHTLLGKQASVRADGSGGTVVLWSDGSTRAQGRISARGGLVETSGKYLDVNGIGVHAGTWLLDPFDIEIVATGGTSTLADTDQFLDPPSFSSINADTLSAVAPGTHIVLQAQHDVKFSAGIKPALGINGSLTVDAGNSILVNAPIETGGGAVKFNANHPDFASKTGAVLIGPGGALDSGGGNVTLSGAQLTLAGPLATRNGNLFINGGFKTLFEHNVNVGDGYLSVTANDIVFGGTGAAPSITGRELQFGVFGGNFGLGANWTLASPFAINIQADTMSLLGTIGPSQMSQPFVQLSPHTAGRPIDIASTGGALSLVLDPAALRRIDAASLGIGNQGYNGTISVLSEYSGGKTDKLSLQTQGNIVVKAPVLLPTGVDSALLLLVNGNIHNSSITTEAGGKLLADHIELQANNMAIGDSIAAVNGDVALMPHMATGQIAIGAGAIDGFDMLGLLDTELKHIAASYLRIGGNDGQMGGLTVTAGGMDFSTMLPVDSELRLLGGMGNLTLNGTLRTPGFLFLEGNHLQTAAGASAAAQAIRMQGHFGVGGNSTPFATQTGYLSISNESPGGLAPINIANTGVLTIDSIHQNGAGNEGAIVIANAGDLAVAEVDDEMVLPSAVFTGGKGTITLKAMGALSVLGNISSQNGAVMLEAGNGGVLKIHPAIEVTSGAGNIGLVAGAVINDGLVKTASGNIAISAPAVAGAGVYSAPGGGVTGLPVKGPSVNECLVNPALAGCTAILKTALDACVATPTGANCLALLPSLAVCTATPSTYGCSVVLPTLTTCTAAPATAGCAVVLPTLAECTGSPTLQGCTAVLPTLSQCAATPDAPGCSVVLLPVTPTADSKLEEAIKVTVDAIAQSTEELVPGPLEDEKKDDSATAVVAVAQGEKPNEIPKSYCN